MLIHLYGWNMSHFPLFILNHQLLIISILNGKLIELIIRRVVSKHPTYFFQELLSIAVIHFLKALIVLGRVLTHKLIQAHL
jgi:hypothetical protein